MLKRGLCGQMLRQENVAQRHDEHGQSLVVEVGEGCGQQDERGSVVSEQMGRGVGVMTKSLDATWRANRSRGGHSLNIHPLLKNCYKALSTLTFPHLHVHTEK